MARAVRDEERAVTEDEPTMCRDTMLDDAEAVSAAKQKELESMKSYDVNESVSLVLAPEAHKIIKTRRVFTAKPVRVKARLVAKGYNF